MKRCPNCNCCVSDEDLVCPCCGEELSSAPLMPEEPTQMPITPALDEEEQSKVYTDSAWSTDKMEQPPKRERKVKKPINKTTNAIIMAVVVVLAVAAASIVTVQSVHTLRMYRQEREEKQNSGTANQPTVSEDVRAYVTGVDDSGLPLRTEIGENGGEIKAMLPMGAEVVVLDSNESAFDYVYYELGNLYGYAKKWNLTQTADAVCALSTCYAAQNEVPVYETPEAAESVDTLNEQKMIYVLAKLSDTRWLVHTGEIYGYVDPSMLTQEELATEVIIGKGPAPTTDTETYHVYDVTNYLALRSKPEYDSENELGAMYQGQTVSVLEKEGKFWYVYSPDLEMYGYTNSDYLTQ